MTDLGVSSKSPQITISKARQLAVFLANQPGTLKNVCDALGRVGINILALSISDTVDHAVVRLVVDDPALALEVLEDHNAMVVEADVLMIESDNRPGTLASIADKLARARVNIEYAYLATSSKSRRGLCIMRPGNIERAMKALDKIVGDV